MARVQETVSVWTEGWDRTHQGDSWSQRWGGTGATWYAALLPRVHAFLPTPTVLEIGPAYGRWSQYLRALCDLLVLVDRAEGSIDACRKRFGSAANIEYHVNDGRSLAMVPDGSVDFAFSFDSLEHAELEALQAYLFQLARKLTPDGIAFIHHADVADDLVRVDGDPGLARITKEPLRAARGRSANEVISTFTIRGSTWDRQCRVSTSRSFPVEARRTAELYARPSFPGPPFS